MGPVASWWVHVLSSGSGGRRHRIRRVLVKVPSAPVRAKKLRTAAGAAWKASLAMVRSSAVGTTSAAPCASLERAL